MYGAIILVVTGFLSFGRVSMTDILMMKKQIFLIDHGTYAFDVLVCIGSTRTEVVDYLAKHLSYRIDEEESQKLEMKGSGRTVRLKNGATVLQVELPRGKSLALFHSNIAHEIFHAVEFLFDHIGIQYDMEKSGEVFAYQIGHLTEQLYEKLK